MGMRKAGVDSKKSNLVSPRPLSPAASPRQAAVSPGYSHASSPGLRHNFDPYRAGPPPLAPPSAPAHVSSVRAIPAQAPVIRRDKFGVLEQARVTADRARVVK